MSPVNGGRCRWCDATVEWVTTEAKGRAMPLDIDAVDDGNVVLVDTPHGKRARVFGRGVTPNVEGPRRTSHHATCPDRPRRGGGADPHLLAQQNRRRLAPRGARR